jgi:Transposase IS4
VRQYNKDKPQKFRVDFFVMACSRTYFIHHIDVYQGANATNTGIHRACRVMPTTQKAVLNAVLHTNMHNKVHGARHTALDNQYQCPEHAFLLKTKLKINSTGTCKVGQKGWNKDLMDLMHKMPRGTYKILIDKNNGVLCCQWVDSRVVNVVSSIILSNKITSVKRQVGSNKKDFDCPWVVTKYQKTCRDWIRAIR